MINPTAAAIQWLVVVLGLALSLGIGWIRRGPRSVRKLFSSAGLAVLLGISLTYIAAYANEMCRTRWLLCPNQYEGNMAYWFFPFFAIPIDWLLMLAFGSRNGPLTFTASPFDAVVDAALGQMHRGEAITQRCPHCQSLSLVENVDIDPAHASPRIRLRCACSKCDRLFNRLTDTVTAP